MDAREEVLKELERMAWNLDNGKLFAGAGWPEILRTAARELRAKKGA